MRHTLLQALVIAAVGFGGALGVQSARKPPADLGSSGGACLAEEAAEIRWIELADAHQLLEDRKATFVDARDPAEYRGGHIPAALNLPYSDTPGAIAERARELSHERLIVAYCDASECGLSQALAELLSRSGCVNVRVMRHGYSAWVGAGYPVESSAR